ncbi:hypothetical protein E9840_11285 [Tissierella creatinini]|nr:hypothetical protein E9840_11285 [Tissierella creatinini]TJX62918.1 hypothetical protein E8P77_16340 [Soehngenia saccharolytica]
MMKTTIDEIFNKKYESFYDLEQSIGALESLKAKGDSMEFFAFFYLKYNANLFNVENVYMENDIPKQIKERIKLEPTDYGVDGVIERKDGKITAYQVKFRTEGNNVTYSELSTFWAESEYADFRLIISNVPTLPKVTDKKKNQSSILLADFLNLDQHFFTALYEFYLSDKKEINRKEPHTPRKYQDKIIDNIISGFNTNDRGKLIAACGVGKTLMALWLQERMQSNHILYVVPSLALIKQTLESWTQNANQEFSFLCVRCLSSKLSHLV